VSRILGIGELLWDMLPDGPRLGGAPANYSVMAARLGNEAALLSRVGDDALGEKALGVLRAFPVNQNLVQIDPEQPTGQVTVKIEEGQPSYTIHQPAAWDFFELSERWLAEAAEVDAVCFGSLAQRSEHSQRTIQALLRATKMDCLRIFDVNLRAPFFTAEILRESLHRATVVKMNDAEVPQVLELLGLPKVASLREGAESLLEQFGDLGGLDMVAITRGGEGSLLVSGFDRHEHPGIPTRVADTIGAGDAFTAAMTHYLLRGAPLAVVNEAGNRWGSFIASQAGAMPEITAETMERIRREIEG